MIQPVDRPPHLVLMAQLIESLLDREAITLTDTRALERAVRRARTAQGRYEAVRRVIERGLERLRSRSAVDPELEIAFLRWRSMIFV